MEIGRPSPRGVTFRDGGINICVFSKHAEAVEFCIFHADGREERFPLPGRSDGLWHGFLSGMGPGVEYGYRVHGPFRPQEGLRFNANRVLLDPYARAITGQVNWSPELFDYVNGHDRLAEEDSAHRVPHSLLVDPAFDWQDSACPGIPWKDTVIYEVHVRGATMLHPAIPAAERGTYRALASEPMLEHYRRLGITTIELLPIHAFLDEPHLIDKGLRNYWGYNTIAFFAPHPGYRSGPTPGDEVRQFKEMVRGLHQAGFEVILDVVFNHTAEGDHHGPTFSFRGLDNRNYYRLEPGDASRYVNHTGTGNALQTENPRVMQLIMDSLRYWVQEMRVDGFRLDLAVSLGRHRGQFDEHAPFFHAVLQDPVLSEVKWIAEPWDAFESGYHLGRFPPPFSEWNDRFRDEMRRLWRSDGISLNEFRNRMNGSPDIFRWRGEGTRPSVNFICAHDGFTLRDLVSYNERHNEPNGESNRDGHRENLSWNCGAEGPTADEGTLELRRRQERNFMASLLLARGIPMLLGGDEFERTQGGNNNAYCQDNLTNHWDWALDAGRESFCDYVAHLVKLRRDLRGLAKEQYLEDDRFSFFDEGGNPLPDMHSVHNRFWCVVLFSESEAFLFGINANPHSAIMHLPAAPELPSRWLRLLDTSHNTTDESREVRPAGASYSIPSHSLAVFQNSAG